jgi:hypothetical protein
MQVTFAIGASLEQNDQASAMVNRVLQPFVASSGTESSYKGNVGNRSEIVYLAASFAWFRTLGGLPYRP